VRWGFGFDDGLEVFVRGAKAVEEIENLAWFRDRVTDIPELIGEAFQLGAIIVNGEITLLHTPELSFQEHGALKLVVAEVALDIGPEGEGGDAWFVNEVEYVGGNGCVDPVDNATVDLAPLDIVLSERCWRTDVVLKPEFVKH
jgi:hypothetical protein